MRLRDKDKKCKELFTKYFNSEKRTRKDYKVIVDFIRSNYDLDDWQDYGILHSIAEESGGDFYYDDEEDIVSLESDRDYNWDVDISGNNPWEKDKGFIKLYFTPDHLALSRMMYEFDDDGFASDSWEVIDTEGDENTIKDKLKKLSDEEVEDCDVWIMNNFGKKIGRIPLATRSLNFKIKPQYLDSNYMENEPDISKIYNKYKSSIKESITESLDDNPGEWIKLLFE